MKKEILKGFSMVMLVVAIALATAVVSANAQSANNVAANIPFAFVVGDQTLDSGKYTLRLMKAPESGLLIQNAAGKTEAMRFTIPIEPRNGKRNALLVFHRYGEHYFLAEVWSGAGETGRNIVKSRQERAIERELSTLASKSAVKGTYDIVEIAVVR